MPRRRPMDTLRRLGRHIRARRLKLGRTKVLVARMAEISTQQLSLYEEGQGHPPAVTLLRIARALGTSTSSLLGEDASETSASDLEGILKLYTDPTIGAVTRHMQDMTKDDRQALQVVAAAFAQRHKAPERVEVMT